MKELEKNLIYAISKKIEEKCIEYINIKNNK